MVLFTGTLSVSPALDNDARYDPSDEPADDSAPPDDGHRANSNSWLTSGVVARVIETSPNTKRHRAHDDSAHHVSREREGERPPGARLGGLVNSRILPAGEQAGAAWTDRFACRAAVALSYEHLIRYAQVPRRVSHQSEGQCRGTRWQPIQPLEYPEICKAYPEYGAALLKTLNVSR